MAKKLFLSLALSASTLHLSVSLLLSPPLSHPLYSCLLISFL
uniref:Uncharacterized protein n=1 Tax=Anguilla anguilla TaxID=7936 RepID=A0A0E9Q987_ANGAN